MLRITHCIFDMDGLLLDTESIYTEISQIILDKYKPGALFTWDIKSQMMGMRTDQAAKLFIDHYGLPLTPEQYSEECAAVHDEKFRGVRPLPGVTRLIYHLHSHNIPIIVATSSTRSKFKIKTSQNQDIFSLFSDAICGDDAGIINGKPAPDLFLAAWERLGRPDKNGCLVFEDAINGVEAALAAGMHVCWVPDPNMLELHGKDKVHDATQVLSSLEDFDPTHFSLPAFKKTEYGVVEEVLTEKNIN